MDYAVPAGLPAGACVVALEDEGGLLPAELGQQAAVLCRENNAWMKKSEQTR